jgi:hypothetical protein
MKFFLVAFLTALATSPSLVLAAPVAEPGDWTYKQVHEYAVKRGGVDDPVADLVARHVGNTERSWDEVYQHDIKIRDGTLTVDSTPAGRLLRRADFPNGAVQAFPWVGNCDDSVSFTWSPVHTDGCYTYSENGNNIRMYSIYISNVWANGDGPEILMFQDSQSCGIFHTFDNRWTSQTSECFGNVNGGRGAMSWELLWPHR